MIEASVFARVFVPLADFSFVVGVLACLAMALRDAGMARGKVLALAGGWAAVWYAAVSWLAARGVFMAMPDLRVPMLPVAVFLPVLVGVVVLPRFAAVRRLLDATPLSRLIRVQGLRVAGVVFLVEWAVGGLPGVFALPAGIGDIAVGLLAPVVARMVAQRAAMATAVAWLWNALGLLDFAGALATGFLSSPGPFQVLAPDGPNRLASAYPLVLIPTFGVPIFLVLHAAAIWKLRREAAGSIRAALSAQGT